MNVHEYQAKALFREYGVAVPAGELATTPEEAERAAKSLATPVVVVKAQVHAGGRGKGGGVKLAKSPAEPVLRMAIEHDEVRFSAGVVNGITTGGPIALHIVNRDRANWVDRNVAPMTVPRGRPRFLTRREVLPPLKRTSSSSTSPRPSAMTAIEFTEPERTKRSDMEPLDMSSTATKATRRSRVEAYFRRWQ